ncbi:MAG: hypothetical protein JSV52_11775 [Candidatus Zixiibacteriota bacterium]|nr:MAG: hypothetical protein JSV52_11775 [candidate division Zixibacteria bacterium]
MVIFIIALFGHTAEPQAGISDDGQRLHPGPRWGHVFIYDPARDNVLLFGGGLEQGVYRNDTWTWDGLRWTFHDIRGPAARGFAAATFDESRQTVVLHGGRANDSTTFSDSWEWDGSQWREIEPQGVYKADHHQMVYVPSEQAIIAYGGWTGEGVTGQTWKWANGWSRLSQGIPPARAAFAMALDTHKEEIYLFGGLWISGQYADLWKWQRGEWVSLSGPYDHSSIDHLAMVYDSSRRKFVAFGGKDYRRIMKSNTLLISASTIEILSLDGPSARHSIGLTYDRRKHQTLLYGGKEYRGQEQIALDDMWMWDGAAWKQIEP